MGGIAALKLFAGVSNLPAHTYPLGHKELAPYEGTYVERTIDFNGEPTETLRELRAHDGHLSMTVTSNDGTKHLGLAFYRDDYVLVLDENGEPDGTRANFERDVHNHVRWLRNHGRFNEHLS